MSFISLTVSPSQLAGLQAACDAYNATLQPVDDVPPVLLDVAAYWDKVYADVAGSGETEQEVFDRATESYQQLFGV